MRKFAVALIAIVALAAISQSCFLPWRANQAAKTLELMTQQALAGNPTAVAFFRDESNLQAAEAWRLRCPDDANLSIAVATGFAIGGRPADALRVYDEAFRYDRRPEMYFNRAGLRLRMNDTAGAFEDYVYAARFNPMLVQDIRTEAIRTRVEAELERLRSEAK